MIKIKTNTASLVSITEANQNFSKVVKQTEKFGKVIILKNNKPCYVITKFSENDYFTENDKLELIARRILSEHKHAFEELGK